MPKVVINRCHGGFGLSNKAIELLFEMKGWDLDKDDSSESYTVYYKKTSEGNEYFYEGDLERDDSELVTVVEKLGEEANGWAADLKIVDVPDDVKWYVDEYDGLEWVAEEHRVWQ